MGGASEQSKGLMVLPNQLATTVQPEIEEQEVQVDEEAVAAAEAELLDFNGFESELQKTSDKVHAELLAAKNRFFQDERVLELRREVDALEMRVLAGNKSVDAARNEVNEYKAEQRRAKEAAEKAKDEQEESTTEEEVTESKGEDSSSHDSHDGGGYNRLPEEEDYGKDKSRNHRRRCKALYLKLAMLGHPDKTSDKRLQELFIAAVAAYQRFDLNALTNLLYIARNGRNSILRDLKRKIEEKKKQIEALVKSIHGMRNSPVANLLRMEAQYGTGVAMATLRNNLNNDKLALERALTEQENMIHKYNMELKYLKDPEAKKRADKQREATQRYYAGRHYPYGI